MSRTKTTPQPTGKRFKSVAALVRHLTPGKRADDIIRFMRNQRARDRREAKRLGITLLQLWQRQK